MQRARPFTLLLATLAPMAGLATTACSDGTLAPETPSMATVAGDYDAAESFGTLVFTTTADGVTTDLLEAGASLELDLAADGTVSGRLFIPGADEDGSDMDADMAGTWTLHGAIVRFEQEADTFVRDMDFAFTDGVLSAERAFDEDDPVHVRVVLVRQ